MFSKVYSAATIGIDAYPVEIEVDITRGLPATIIVGLPDTATKESRDRVKSAIKNSQFEYPTERVTINLAPADIKKEGPSFDLPIALGILSATGQIDSSSVSDFIILGELALDGSLRPIKGTLPIAMAVKNFKRTKLILPLENAKEGEIVEGIEVYPVDSLIEVTRFFRKEIKILPYHLELNKIFKDESFDNDMDFSDVKGQGLAKRALEIAATGGHNVLMIGPPGSGKTMLAKRLTTIIPDMCLEESLETTKIHSVAGLVNSKNLVISKRPFRTPHHTASDVALVGGGSVPKPGEVSLAHNGILFLDELPEFNRSVLEALRQPLEEGKITVSRINNILTFPARFMLICAMNPCPCGYYTDPKKSCHCTPNRIEKYLSKISGPLLDRIDIHIEVPSIKYNELSGETTGESSEIIKRRVEQARKIQRERFNGNGIFSNAQMSHRHIKRYCKIDNESKELLKSAINELGFSVRCYHKILKVARTIADLEGKENIEPDNISEAIQYRSLDRNLWM